MSPLHVPDVCTISVSGCMIMGVSLCWTGNPSCDVIKQIFMPARIRVSICSPKKKGIS